MAFVKCIDSQKMEVKSKWLEAVYDSIEEQMEFILAHCLYVMLEVKVVKDPNTYNTLWKKIRYYWTWKSLAFEFAIVIFEVVVLMVIYHPICH